MPITEDRPKLGWRSRLIHSDAKAPEGFKSLATPVYRGSTVVFDRLADARDDWSLDGGYTYGLYGTPTTIELARRIAELEGARHSFMVPGGQAAIALVFLAMGRAGSHVLVPDSAYGPTREFALGLLAKLGVEVETYPALAGAAVEPLIRPNTALLWCESPGSITMEVQDVPALAAAAHRHGVSVAIDNTYAAGVLFDAFGHGADISVQALTKYVGGHSDLLLGTVSVADDKHRQAIGDAHRLLGMAVSPDDCSLALRGLQTLGVRLDRLERTTLAVAAWLAERPEVEAVLHPALPACPGHETWRRDFTGSSSVFSIVFGPGRDEAWVTRFVEGLRLFKLGYSWGGATSLVMAYRSIPRLGTDYAGRLVRLNVGLEDEADLIADLDTALRRAGE
ncbi:cystathionine beta-lyase [Inquilinus sp.]|uniref:cystathionine beta-lyase n=1 Tax=Inquilinus sp. TaxID=1932117 RepID=UPI003783018B